ncbi:diguanylate cyclase [Persephonella sp.]
MKSNAVRKFTYVVVFIITAAFILLSGYQIYTYEELVDNALFSKYRENKNSIALFKNLQEQLLVAVAISVGEDERLKKYLRENDREKAFQLVKRKWNELKKRFNLSEIHIIDKNGISFVNFIDYGAREFGEKDVYTITAFRKDINRSLETGEMVSTLFVCRYFVGFRAIYPVKDNTGELVGVVSVGKSINNTIPLIKKYLKKNSFAVLDKRFLKQCLKPEVIESTDEYRNGKGDFVIIGSTNGIKHSVIEQKILEDDKFFVYSEGDREYLFTLYPLKDFNGRTIGFIVFQDDVSYLIEGFNSNVFNLFVVYMFLLIATVLAIGYMSRLMEKRISEVEEITERLSIKDFSVLERYRDEKREFNDDLDRLKYQIVKMGKELYRYITDMNRQMLKLSEETYTDPLLGILNRRALMKVGNSEFEKAKLRGIPLSVMVLDLDNFKNINDTYGHSAGDMVLEDFAEIVKRLISTRELFFRIGGEEFLIILPGADLKKAVEIGEKIKKEVENSVVDVNGKKIRYTVSIGVAQATEKDRDIYSVISRADENLYKAKREGRNRVVS